MRRMAATAVTRVNLEFISCQITESAIVELVRILGSHPSDLGSSPGGGIVASTPH